MNRKLYGKRSGVIVDSCRDHGLWLDAGKLRQLMEWSRAGGEKLDQENRAFVTKQKIDQKRRRTVQAIYQKEKATLNHSTKQSMSRQHQDSASLLDALVDTIIDLFGY